MQLHRSQWDKGMNSPATALGRCEQSRRPAPDPGSLRTGRPQINERVDATSNTADSSGGHSRRASSATRRADPSLPDCQGGS